jgi:hypothetical protein
MKSKENSLKGICWGPTIYCSKQNKKSETKTTDAPRKTHSA